MTATIERARVRSANGSRTGTGAGAVRSDHHRPRTSGLGTHLHRHHRAPPARTSTAGCRAASAPCGPGTGRRHQATPNGFMVVEGSRTRRAQHRRLLRPALRRRLPTPRRRRSDPRRCPTTGRRSARGRVPGRTIAPFDCGGRHARRRRGRAPGPSIGCCCRHRRRPRRTHRCSVDGVRRRPDEALGTSGPARRLHQLAAHRRRRSARTDRTRGRRATPIAHRPEPDRVRLARHRRRRRVLPDLVPRRRPPSRCPGLPARPHESDRRHRRRPRRPRSDPHSGPAARRRPGPDRDLGRPAGRPDARSTNPATRPITKETNS